MPVVKHMVSSHPAKHKPNVYSWERATNSLLPRVPSTPAVTDVVHTHRRHCLTCPGTQPSLLQRNTAPFLKLGMCWGRGCFQGLQQPGKCLINTHSFQRTMECWHSCKLALEPGWYFILREVSVTGRIIMKKPKVLRLLTAASGKDMAGCYPGAISNTTNKKNEGKHACFPAVFIFLKKNAFCATNNY